MITKDKMIPMLLQAAPSFTEIWESNEKDFEDLPYMHLNQFGRHIVQLEINSSTEEFPKIFEAVERLHLEGDEYVKEAATVGVLEAIQNHALDRKIDPKIFEKYLLPKSKENWDRLINFWDGQK
jgi:hypothetical protein